ncbi:MAG: lactate utilization protein C [Planctomycetota bacterium]
MTGRSPAVASLVARVRDAVRTQPVAEAEVPTHAVVRRVAGDGADLPALFAAKAHAVGMRVTRIGAGGLEDALRSMLEGRGRTVVAARDAALAHIAIAAAGSRLAPNDDDDILFDCEVGITDVDAAIAESGSIVVSTNGRIRNAWITPPIHIAIVRVSQLLPDLVDLFELHADALDAASTTVITGPSKTADIEGVLVTGVHGPAAVDILLVD